MDPIEPTGVPLVDAVIAALVCAREEGREAGATGTASPEAHDRTLAALAEVQRLWGQVEIELAATRRALRATALGVR